MLIVFLIIVILVIYTFILYAIGVAFLRSHYKISIDGNVLHLNSLDVERYYSNYIDPTQQQHQTSRILQSSEDLSKTKKSNNNIRENKNSNVKPKLVKSSNNNRFNRLIIDNNKELHLKTKSVESENAYIDGKTEFFGDVKFGNATKPVNVEIDNGGFKVKSLTVTDTIDLTKSKFVWDSEDQLNNEEYKNVKIGKLNIRMLDIESKICNVSVSSITNINGVKFTSPNTISSDDNLILKPGINEGDKISIKGTTYMENINLGDVFNGGKIYVGLKDKSFEAELESSVMKLYINDERQSVIDTFKMEVQSSLESKAIYVDNIRSVLPDVSNTINLLSSINADQQTISVTNLVAQNAQLFNILCKEKDNDGKCKDTERLTINKNVNMNDYNINQVGALKVSTIASASGKINMMSDLNLNNNIIEDVNTIKVNKIQSLGGDVTFASGISTGSYGITAHTIELTDSLSTPVIKTASPSITIMNDLNLGANSINSIGEINGNKLSANSILTNNIGVISGASVITVTSDLNLGTSSILAKEIKLDSLKTDTIAAKTVNGDINVNNNIKLGTNTIATTGTITAGTVSVGTITSGIITSATSISTPKLTSTAGEITVEKNLDLQTYNLNTGGTVTTGKLEVKDSLKIPSVAGPPTCSIDGSLFYDSSIHVLYVCINGSAKNISVT